MRKLLILFFLFPVFTVIASTSITTPTVSGHWTLAGSPYQVFNSITIDNSSSLVIDPGVSVVFMGSYYINVLGILKAAGTAAQPISFSANDTTGWYDSSIAAGGWLGIQFQAFGGTGTDSSTLQYCNISYTKFDSLAAFTPPASMTSYISRGMTVSNCNFTYNKSSFAQCIFAITHTGQVVDFEGCNFHDNSFWGPIVRVDNTYGGHSYVRDCKFYQNYSDNEIFLTSIATILFENSDFYNNSANYGTLLLQGNWSFPAGYDTIRRCKFYQNTNVSSGALVGYGGIVDIEANYVCNNRHNAGPSYCGSIDGGGGMNLGTSGGYGSYNVHNNIIANNYSPFRGGAIYVQGSPANISSNQIINNKGYGGSAVFVYSTAPLILKDNIFYGNVEDSDINAANSPIVEGYGPDTIKIEYDHNWSEHSTAFDLNLGPLMVNSGDTTTNVHGTDPGLVSPTTTANYLVSALTADFSLKSTSPCINKGDTTGACTPATDYAGHQRIVGTSVDIGAYEFNPISLYASTVPPAPSQTSIYPNPASTMLTIAAPDKISTISICNLLGKVLVQQEFNAEKAEINIAGLSAGVYLVRINETDVRKFVKE